MYFIISEFDSIDLKQFSQEAVQEYNKKIADEAQSVLSERLNPYFHPILLEKELEAPFMRLFSVPHVLQPRALEEDWVASSMVWIGWIFCTIIPPASASFCWYSVWQIFSETTGHSLQKEGSELMHQLYYGRDVMVHMFPYPTSELSMRVSAQVYNTRADYIRAADALLALLEERDLREYQKKM